jgi:hypothetical protein
VNARGIRNLNPGNLRHGPKWQGLAGSQPDSAFSTFVDMEHGIRALLINLRTYVQTHNLQTVRQIISRWAPASENNTDAYVLAVAESLGVGPDQKIVGDFGQLLGIAKAIARHENGADASLITKDQWNRGFELAFGEPEEITVPKLGPIVPTKPITEHQTMPIAPILAAVLPTFLEAAPKLIRIFGDGKQSDKNARAAQIVADIAKEATGERNEQAAAEAIASEPKAAQAFQAAVHERWFELTEVGGGVQEARAFTERLIGLPDWRGVGFSILMGVLALTIVFGGGLMLWSLLQDPATPPEQKGMVLGAIIATIGAPVAFFFGSSASSRAKDQALIDRR